MPFENTDTEDELISTYLKRVRSSKNENWYKEGCFLIQQNLKRTFNIECTEQEADDFWTTYSNEFHHASWIDFHWLNRNDPVPSLESDFKTIDSFINSYFKI